MSENQTSAKSTVEGELSLDDLEKIAGGTGSLASTEDAFKTADVNFLPKQDGMFAVDGQKGTTLDQASYSTAKSLDPNELKFP